MGNCGQACPYNTLDGCKVKEYNAICPLSNMATPITEYKMTHADHIRAMSDEELAEFISDCGCPNHSMDCMKSCKDCTLKWLKQPVGDDNG